MRCRQTGSDEHWFKTAIPPPPPPPTPLNASPLSQPNQNVSDENIPEMQNKTKKANLHAGSRHVAVSRYHVGFPGLSTCVRVRHVLKRVETAKYSGETLRTCSLTLTSDAQMTKRFLYPVCRLRLAKERNLVFFNVVVGF